MVILQKIQNYDLPSGYHFEFYKPGDENKWVEIHMSSGEFCNFNIGLGYFHDFF